MHRHTHAHGDADTCSAVWYKHAPALLANAVRLEALGIEEVADIEQLSGGALEPSMAPLPPAGGVSPPPGLTWLVRARGGRNYSTAVYRAVVLALTFGTYALYHATRKPMSIVKYPTTSCRRPGWRVARTALRRSEARWDVVLLAAAAERRQQLTAIT